MSIKVCTRAEGEFYLIFFFSTKFQCTIPILAMYVGLVYSLFDMLNMGRFTIQFGC